LKNNFTEDYDAAVKAVTFADTCKGVEEEGAEGAEEDERVAVMQLRWGPLSYN